MLTIFLDWLSIKHLYFHSQVSEKRLLAHAAPHGVLCGDAVLWGERRRLPIQYC